MSKQTIFKDFKIPLLLSLTIGLAPFFPEPHIWGKLRWIASGAQGMAAMDWFDVFLHGLPWLWLIIVLIFKGYETLNAK